MTDGAATPGAEPDPYGVRIHRRPSEGTHLVDGVRAAVDAWRANGYPGASETTQRLLRFWFEEDHRRPTGEPFRFFFCQREAVETFIYLSEIKRAGTFSDLIEYAQAPLMIDPAESKRQRLAMKMATGSGKTMAMSLCVTWSYFHARRELGSPMATSFLVIAPNVIVFERLWKAPIYRSTLSESSWSVSACTVAGSTVASRSEPVGRSERGDGAPFSSRQRSAKRAGGSIPSAECGCSVL